LTSQENIMSIELPPDVEAIAQQKAAALGGSVAPSDEVLMTSGHHIERAMADVKAGRTKPAKDALREIAAEFGLNPPQ
jgi:hypothetical protein